VIAGQTLASYVTGVLSTTSYYSVEVTDSSPGSPAGLSTVCASIKVAVGNGPEGIASNPVTGFVYVADPLTNHISVINSISDTVVTNITVGTQPWGIAVDTTNNLIYVTNYGSGTVSIIDGNTNALCVSPRCAANTIVVDHNPEGIAINLKLGEVYVANSGSNDISVINVSTDAVIAKVAVGNSPMNVAVGPSTSTPPYTVFVTNYGSNTVTVISLTSPFKSYPVTTIPVGSNPWGVAVNQLTDVVYVTNAGSGTVTVVNGSTFVTMTTISLGTGITPAGIAVDAATATAYVADANTNAITAINLVTNTLITSTSPSIPIPVGSGPWGISVLLYPVNTSYPNLGFVTNAGTNTVSVINLADNELIDTITVS
jgi:YVTN family beta-propeller protein